MNRHLPAYELTLCLLKPHLLKNPFAHKGVHKIIKDENFEVLKSKKIHLTHDLASEFYKEHKNRFFFNRLISFMCSDLIEACILKRENAISKWREVLGPTSVFKTIHSHPNSIRGLYGLTDTRNAAHGSDSEESALREIKLVFPDFNIDSWKKEKG